MLKNLASLTSAELKSFLNSFDSVLCDCDGVIWKLNNPIAGVQETLALLKELGKQVHYVSNNCLYRAEDFQKKLNSFHLEAQAGDVAFPILAIIAYLKKIKYNKEIFLFGFPAARQEFLKAGFKIAHPGPEKVDERPEHLPRSLQDNEDIGAVVIDLELNLNYVKLLKAAVYLQRPEVLFITTGTDKKIPFGFNVMLLGPAYFTNMLEDLAGRTATVFGKPSDSFNDYIVNKFNIKDPSRTLFIGDSLEQDMGFAAKYDYQKLLVLTGVTNLNDAVKCTDKEKIPDFYISSLGDLHEIFKNAS